MLDPEEKETVLGQAEIRDTFHHSAIGTIGGFHVVDGSIPREISSLKHLKDDIKEAKIDSEGGLTIKNYNDIKVNDVIEAYKIEIITK
ncbi:hypothetical protein FQA39_LY12898 [Lamprigera yunnana]|nr:hypothetical protein FQA39_LY12898 [Lamprigera yunnana]